jgi:hypothetical protein
MLRPPMRLHHSGGAKDGGDWLSRSEKRFKPEVISHGREVAEGTACHPAKVIANLRRHSSTATVSVKIPRFTRNAANLK